jgi:hypothetical protein
MCRIIHKQLTVLLHSSFRGRVYFDWLNLSPLACLVIDFKLSTRVEKNEISLILSARVVDCMREFTTLELCYWCYPKLAWQVNSPVLERVPTQCLDVGTMDNFASSKTCTLMCWLFRVAKRPTCPAPSNMDGLTSQVPGTKNSSQP